MILTGTMYKHDIGRNNLQTLKMLICIILSMLSFFH